MESQPHPLAQLNIKDGLEWWEWIRPEDGVRQIQLTGKGCLTDEKTDALAAEYLDESHYVLLVRGEDVDVYKPRMNGALSLLATDDAETPESRILLSLRKRVLPADECSEAYKILRYAAGASKNRGAAAGKITPEGMKRDASRIIQRGATANYYTKDGLLSSTSESNLVYSGIAGYFNATPRNPYCRQTAFTRDRFEEFQKSMPMIESINRAFKRFVPGRWENQRRYVTEETDLKKKDWTLGDTVFSTITVNKNYRTGCHKDAGDYFPGFGNLTVLEGGAHKYKGAHTVFPKFRCAVDLRTSDFIAMDVHEWHGNTKLESVVEGDDDWERISIVCYVRVDMTKCGTQEEERAKYDAWSKDWRNPVDQHVFRLGQDQKSKVEDAQYLDILMNGNSK